MDKAGYLSIGRFDRVGNHKEKLFASLQFYRFPDATGKGFDSRTARHVVICLVNEAVTFLAQHSREIKAEVINKRAVALLNSSINA